MKSPSLELLKLYLQRSLLATAAQCLLVCGSPDRLKCSCLSVIQLLLQDTIQQPSLPAAPLALWLIFLTLSEVCECDLSCQGVQFVWAGFFWGASLVAFSQALILRKGIEHGSIVLASHGGLQSSHCIQLPLSPSLHGWNVSSAQQMDPFHL